MAPGFLNSVLMDIFFSNGMWEHRGKLIALSGALQGVLFHGRCRRSLRLFNGFQGSQGILRGLRGVSGVSRDDMILKPCSMSAFQHLGILPK